MYYSSSNCVCMYTAIEYVYILCVCVCLCVCMYVTIDDLSMGESLVSFRRDIALGEYRS